MGTQKGKQYWWNNNTDNIFLCSCIVSFCLGIRKNRSHTLTHVSHGCGSFNQWLSQCQRSMKMTASFLLTLSLESSSAALAHALDFPSVLTPIRGQGSWVGKILQGLPWLWPTRSPTLVDSQALMGHSWSLSLGMSASVRSQNNVSICTVKAQDSTRS